MPNERGIQRLCAAALLFVVGCSSSDTTEIDPLAESYCAACCDSGAGCPTSCPNVVNLTLQEPCPDETRAYYRCVTDSACDVEACQTEWEARATCMEP